ncbi:MAG: hypothetical protein ACLP59_22940 [Bryobacteraceae bacterium]
MQRLLQLLLAHRRAEFDGITVDRENDKGTTMNHKENGIQREERQLLAKWPEVIISIVGFFLALFINSWIARQGEIETYQEMLKAVEKEANLNKAVLDEKVIESEDGKLIVGDLSTGVLAQTLANPLFVSHAGDANLGILEKYLADSTRVGSFRRALEELALSSLTNQDKETLTRPIKGNWANAERSLNCDLQKVKEIK